MLFLSCLLALSTSMVLCPCMRIGPAGLEAYIPRTRWCFGCARQRMMTLALVSTGLLHAAIAKSSSILDVSATIGGSLCIPEGPLRASQSARHGNKYPSVAANTMLLGRLLSIVLQPA